MLVFEATDQLQGARDTDYHHAWTGELVHLPALDCASPKCGCTQGFAGFDSHLSTTTAIVVERPDMTIEQLTKALAVSLNDGGWIDAPDPADPLVAGLATEIVELAASYGRYGPGAVIERDGEELCHRLPPGVHGMSPTRVRSLDAASVLGASDVSSCEAGGRACGPSEPVQSRVSDRCRNVYFSFPAYPKTRGSSCPHTLSTTPTIYLTSYLIGSIGLDSTNLINALAS